MSKAEEIPEDIIAVIEAPNPSLEMKWNSLYGIDAYKRVVLSYMRDCLDKTKIESWCKRYYPNSNGLLTRMTNELGFSGKVALFGDSGTGKTQFAEGLADALAKTVGKVYLIKIGLLRSKYVGSSSLKVTKAFRYAKEKAKDAPVLLFIEEFDSVAPNRDNSQMHEEVKAAVNTLLEEIDSITPTDRVLVIAATNLLSQSVDYAAERRFDMAVNFKRPTFAQRIDLLTCLLKDFNISSNDIILLTKGTNGYTPADIKKAVKHALNRCLSYNRKLTVRDLIGSLKYVKPTRSYGANGHE
ncbi:MAG: ATP-binding protein [Candidatus Bathyarchaeota archaeon]|nr:ATP-binding protein [Candidatus Bathyarchaeota archaeon]